MTNLKAPLAQEKPFNKTDHNETRVDEYHWLRDDNWPNVKDEEVLSYLKTENAHTEQFFKPHEHLQKQLLDEMKLRIVEEDESYPEKHDDYFYYNKTEKGKDHKLYYRKKGSLNNKEELLLDANELAKGSKAFSLGGFTVNSKHNLLAYSVDLDGEERYKICIKNLENSTILEDVIRDTLGRVVWHESLNGFFYIKLDENWRNNQVYFHKLGTSQSQDILVYKEKDKKFHVSINKTSDRRFLIINTATSESAEQYFLNITAPNLLEPQLLFKRKEKLLYGVDHKDGRFFIIINDYGKNYRLVKVKDSEFDNKDKWEEVIPHNKDVYLDGFSLSQNYLVVNRKINGINKPLVMDNEGNAKEIKFLEDIYDAYVYFPSYKNEFARIEYSSLITPNSVLEYDFKADETFLRKEQKIPSGYNKNDYASKRVYAKANDGTLIPISLVYKKDKFNQDGTNPLYLEGYGSYGYGYPTYFSANKFSLINRGFVYAIAHVRGGDELGFEWYENAKFLNKKLTFTDFIACGDYLVKEKYTSANKLFASGGSAGGMLMGVVANMRPDLFKGIIARVPFVDVLNTMLDDSLPLTPGEYDEWGNPAEKQYYDYIKSYSPYDNVKKQNYPALFVTAGLTDPRVTYWEPAKWVARLRKHNLSNNPILLYTEMESGHAGQRGRYSALNEVSKIYTFVLAFLTM